MPERTKAAELSEALGEGLLDYKLVQQPIDANSNLSNTIISIFGL